MDTYRPLKTLSVLAIIGLAGICLFSILQILLSFGEIMSPESTIDIEGDLTSVWLTLMGIVTILRFPVFIFTVVVFLIWLNRGFKNLSPLNASSFETTPGWAVGYWFIPILNLFKPYQTMRELWVESDPEFDPDLSFAPSDYSAPAFMGFWWATWIIFNITSNVSNRLIDDKDTNLSAGFLGIFLMSSIAELLAGILAIMMVRKITQRQDQRSKRIESLNGDFQLPPAPPTFGA